MKKTINTPNSPAPIGPYNQAILAGNTLYTSGQIALHPITMELVLDTIEAETFQVMHNLNAVLNAADMNFEDVVKATIFITDMTDFETINKVYATFFHTDFAPARETVQVAALPKGVHVEISVIAIK